MTRPTRHAATALLLMLLSGCAIFDAPHRYMPSRAGLQAGQSVTVQPNENVYRIARAHNVSMRDIIVLNNLRPPYDIRPGMQLVLPASGTGASFSSDSMPPPAAAPRDAVESTTLGGIAPVSIQPAGVSSEDLPALAPAATAPAPPSPTITGKPVSLTLAPDTVPLSTPPAPVPLSSATPVVPAPVKAADTDEGGSAMIWPLQGPIVSAFGTRASGLSNDGVNIGAPRGSPVVASAAGTVVYTGDEMKGFGNLVLIRHAGDWVTAYAHLDRVLVKKDMTVAQGTEIGTVGKTGNVTAPQLHFEVRKNGKPVDPATAIKTAG